VKILRTPARRRSRTKAAAPVWVGMGELLSLRVGSLRARSADFSRRPRCRQVAPWRAEPHLPQPLEPQDSPCLVRGGRFEAEFAEDAGHLGDLIGVAPGELSLADVDAVLQANAHIAAHRGGGEGDRELETPGGRDRPLEVAEELPRLVVE